MKTTPAQMKAVHELAELGVVWTGKDTNRSRRVYQGLARKGLARVVQDRGFQSAWALTLRGMQLITGAKP